jgi:hypothetical protein
LFGLFKEFRYSEGIDIGIHKKRTANLTKNIVFIIYPVQECNSNFTITNQNDECFYGHPKSADLRLQQTSMSNMWKADDDQTEREICS